MDPESLKILACPACENRPPVKKDETNSKLVCTSCGKVYPIRDGIPIMIVKK